MDTSSCLVWCSFQKIQNMSGIYCEGKDKEKKYHRLKSTKKTRNRGGGLEKITTSAAGDNGDGYP